MIPIEKEIARVQKLKDHAEWEGLRFDHYDKQLESLKKQQSNGELYYVNF